MLRLAEVVSVDPSIVGGMPVFRGTDVPLASLLEGLRAGETIDDFTARYPSVGRDRAVRFLELATEGVLRVYEASKRSAGEGARQRAIEGAGEGTRRSAGKAARRSVGEGARPSGRRR